MRNRTVIRILLVKSENVYSFESEVDWGMVKVKVLLNGDGGNRSSRISWKFQIEFTVEEVFRKGPQGPDQRTGKK